MSAEDQSNMRNQIPPVSNFERKRSRRRAIVLAASTMVSILFFLYAYLQKLEADKQSVLAEQRRIEYEIIKGELEKTRAEAEMAQAEAVRQQKIAEEQRVRAEQAVENCKKSKR